jgi:glycosyltransferase involved in cell wall biosynthesis
LVRRNPAIAARLHVTGELLGEHLSRHLSACDLMIQPYPDGISARRTSAMAALAHGRPVVTTVGRLTESLWTESGAVATVPVDDATRLAPLAISLLESHSERQRLALSGAALYQERFELCHTINALRDADADCDSKLVQP